MFHVCLWDGLRKRLDAAFVICDNAIMESVSEILARHEHALLQRVAELRKELEPLEAELDRVRLARAAISSGSSGVSAESKWVVRVRRNRSVHDAPIERMTMKQLVIKALSENFPRGATASRLLDFFAETWGRNDVVRSSLSPQLTRLHRDGWIKLLDDNVWIMVSNIPGSSMPPADNEGPEQNEAADAKSRTDTSAASEAGAAKSSIFD